MVCLQQTKQNKQTINLAHIYQNNVLNFKPASDWERKGMVVDDRQAGPNVSETAVLPGISLTAISSVYREWHKNVKNIQ